MVAPAIAVILARELGQDIALRVLGRVAQETDTPVDDAAVAVLRTADQVTDLKRAARAAIDPTTPARLLAPVKKKKRKPSAYNRMFAKHYKAEKAKATTKSGRLRKGVDHKVLLERAHRCCRRDLNKQKKRRGGRR